MTDMDPQTCAVEQKMQWTMGGRLELDLTQRLQTPGQRRVIGNWQVHIEHLGQGT
jgi:hypothetical protein